MAAVGGRSRACVGSVTWPSFTGCRCRRGAGRGYGWRFGSGESGKGVQGASVFVEAGDVEVVSGHPVADGGAGDGGRGCADGAAPLGGELGGLGAGVELGGHVHLPGHA